MPSTTFKVTNKTNGNLANSNILVFLTPVQNAKSWIYAAWQTLDPGENGTKSFTLTTDISACMTDGGTYQSDTVHINPGQMYEYVNLGNLLPILRPLDPATANAPVVTMSQSGIKNNTKLPGSAHYAQWIVNGNVACQSLTPIWAGGTLSAFELDLVLYFAVGNEQVKPLVYRHDEITTNTAYRFTPDVSQVEVTVGFDDTAKVFTWSFT